MSIQLLRNVDFPGQELTGWSPVGNSLTCLAGDVNGLTTGGLLNRLSSGTVISSGGGIWGIAKNDFTSDGSGNIINPSAPSGVASNVPANLAIGSYSQRIRPNQPISGVFRGEAQYWLPDFSQVFIQRHKQGTRVNAGLCGKKCDLVYNATTAQWEVDTTATSVNDIVIASAELQDPTWRDNTSLWDSSTFATDPYGAWIAWRIVPAFNAQQLGLRY